MKKIFLVLSFILFLTACQSAKDALTLKKKNSGDEFLVEKKSPLVLPPDYGELPEPGKVSNIKEKSSADDDIQITLSDIGLINENKIINSEPTSIEKSVLDKIE
tara:strand:- start:1158 stop:1469 length:312 start_codon:yes stop_codon:yes gene_type:complete